MMLLRPIDLLVFLSFLVLLSSLASVPAVSSTSPFRRLAQFNGPPAQPDQTTNRPSLNNNFNANISPLPANNNNANADADVNADTNNSPPFGGQIGSQQRPIRFASALSAADSSTGGLQTIPLGSAAPSSVAAFLSSSTGSFPSPQSSSLPSTGSFSSSSGSGSFREFVSAMASGLGEFQSGVQSVQSLSTFYNPLLSAAQSSLSGVAQNAVLPEMPALRPPSSIGIGGSNANVVPVQLPNLNAGAGPQLLGGVGGLQLPRFNN